MLTLALATVFSAGFGLVLRWAQERRCNAFAVGLTNYVIATLFQLVRMFAAGEPSRVSSPTLWMGIVVGVIYALNFAIFSPLIARKGVSITTAVVRMAVVVPIIGAVLIWRETPTWLQWLGIVLTLVSMPLLTLKPNGGTQLDRSAIPLVALMFVGSGSSMLLFNAYQKLGLPGEDSLFLVLLFGSAMVVTGIAWWMHREGTSARDILPGIALGLTNALANTFLMTSLQGLPSVLVFPFYSAVGLVFSALFAWLAWGERFSRLETAGMVVALGAVVLTNLA